MPEGVPVKRFEIIDGMRGYFLVFMLINHLIFVGGYWMAQVSYSQLAFVEDAQGFVFLSGLLVGWLYAPRMQKHGYVAVRDRIWRRAFDLYRWDMGIVIAILVAQMLLPDAAAIWYNWLGVTNFDELQRLAAIGTFLFQPTFMDILPQYVICMALSPMLIALCLKGRWGRVLLGSVLVWIMGQLGLVRLVTDPLSSWITTGDGQGIRISFNILGWQLLFMSALVIGALTANKTIDWTRILTPENSALPKAALAICVVFLPLRILTAHDWLPLPVMQKFMTLEIRSDFSIVYVMNFAAAALGVAWLVVAGPRHHSVWVQRLAKSVIGLLSLRFLRLLGRHSLHVYVWHVAIVYAVYYIDARTPEFSEFAKTLIALASIGLLALPALWRERDRFLGGPPMSVAT